MRANIASIVANNYVGMENMDETEFATLNERQEDMAVDGEAMSKEMDMLTQTQTALESILTGLQDLKKSGKGLSLESSKFVQIYLSDASSKFGSIKPRVSLESFATDEQRLDIALEGVMDYLASVIKSKFSFYIWIVHNVAEYFDNAREKAVKIKNDLGLAVAKYKQNGQTTEDTISGNFGESLLKDDESEPATKTVLDNVKQYSGKINDPAKVKALSVVSECADDVIGKIRSNWFFASNSDVKELEAIKERMADALRAYDETEKNVIGQGQYNLTFNDEGVPRLSRVVTSKQKQTRAFKPLNENEFKQFSNELENICDRSIALAETYRRHAEKIRSIYGFSTVNNVLRLGPKILGILATLVAGPVVGSAIASTIPSRDIMHAMMFTNYTDVLRTYMYHDAKQREKVLADGILYIKKSTA